MNQLNLFPQEKTNTTKKTSPKKNILDAYRKQYAEINWQHLVWKILVALRVPLTSAKHQLITSGKAFLNIKPFPWFRVALVLLFAYVFFKKDLQFNINMGGDSGILSEEKSKTPPSKLTMGGFAQTANYTKEKTNTIHLNDSDVAAYIKRFRKVAIVEMNKFGIPASIKMGQAILASHAGKNSLAQQFNNHFALTCNEGTNCENFQVGNQTAMIKTYQSAWESWRNHSQLLSSDSYAHLKSHNKQYKKWAKGLEKAGYGNANNYSHQLIQVIERYDLMQLDHSNENL